MNNDPFASLNIMAIDDEEFARLLVTRLLGELRVNSVVTAIHGVDAISQLEAPESDIHLVICDIEMPEMNGYEFVRRIRYGTIPKYKDLPIIMLTGKDTDKNVRSARIHKINGFVVKPPNIETLKDHIRRVLSV